MDEGMKDSSDFLKWLRDAALRELQRQQNQPESIGTEIKELSQKRLRQGHPDWDDASVREIAEEMACVYQRLREVCRGRLQQARPDLDDVGVQMRMMLISHPPIQLVESELLRRMHLAQQDRVQQVAVIMADKVLEPTPASTLRLFL